MFCLSDFEAYARKVLDRNAWGYYSSGANQEQTLRDNEEAFRKCGDAYSLRLENSFNHSHRISYYEFSVSPPLATGIVFGLVC